MSFNATQTIEDVKGQIAALENVLSSLVAISGEKRRGRKPGRVAAQSTNGTGTGTVKPKRQISAASRRKMALAQQARWAAIKAAKSQPKKAVKSAKPRKVNRKSADKSAAATA